MTAVIYARYSSDSQREASIEGQLRDCKDYAERNGITVVGTYIDRAYSAKTDDRYKCGRAKRRGKEHCDLRAIRKEPLERFVADTALNVIFNHEIIDHLADLILEAQAKENTRLPALRSQLRDVEKRLANLLEAIERGILTPTTKQRLDELEARRDALNVSILEEELQTPPLSREQILFWFEQFRHGDVNSTAYQRQIIDTFVDSVYIFDDRVALNFNFKDTSKIVTREEVLGSADAGNGPPKQCTRIFQVRVLFCLPQVKIHPAAKAGFSRMSYLPLPAALSGLQGVPHFGLPAIQTGHRNAFER